MTDVKLLQDEKLIDSLSLNCGQNHSIGSTLNGSKWWNAKLTFTSNRIVYADKWETLNYSYDNIVGLEITKEKLPPKVLYIILAIVGYFILFMVGGLTGFWMLSGIAIGLAFVSLLILYFGFSIKTDRIRLVSSSDSDLLEIDIKRDQTIVERILQNYEKARHKK